jgi:hypothetical protein
MVKVHRRVDVEAVRKSTETRCERPNRSRGLASTRSQSRSYRSTRTAPLHPDQLKFVMGFMHVMPH